MYLVLVSTDCLVKQQFRLTGECVRAKNNPNVVCYYGCENFSKVQTESPKDAKGLSRKQSLKPSLSAKILLGGTTPGQQGEGKGNAKQCFTKLKTTCGASTGGLLSHFPRTASRQPQWDLLPVEQQGEVLISRSLSGCVPDPPGNCQRQE